MKDWEKFEIDCKNYLNATYGNNFERMGSSDSTVSDIKYTSPGESFYIEAKMKNSQSGQFVLLTDNEKKKFIFSPRNKSGFNESTKLIIAHMDKYFDRYVDAGTAGIDIEVEQEIIDKWIIDYYLEKQALFFITKGDCGYIIFPIDRLNYYFQATAKFRQKKSGSKSVAKSRQAEVIEKLDSMYVVDDLLDGFIIRSSEDLEDKKFTVGEYDYILRRVSGSDLDYRVRQLSNTNNYNVIFTLNLINEQDHRDLHMFENRINYFC